MDLDTSSHMASTIVRYRERVIHLRSHISGGSKRHPRRRRHTKNMLIPERLTRLDGKPSPHHRWLRRSQTIILFPAYELGHNLLQIAHANNQVVSTRLPFGRIAQTKNNCVAVAAAEYSCVTNDCALVVVVLCGICRVLDQLVGFEWVADCRVERFECLCCQ